MCAQRVRSEALAPCLGLAALLVTLFIPAVATAQPATANPVKELQEALSIQFDERDNRAALDLRETVLTERISRLTTVDQMRQALLLGPQDWKDGPQEPPRLRAIDQAARAGIADKLTAQLDRAAREQFATRRLAAAVCIGELSMIRSAQPLDHKGFARSLAPLLIKMTQDADSEVRQAAARSVGKINPDPAVAAEALAALMLRKGLSPADATAEKRAAASALLEMIQVAAKLFKAGQAQHGVLATPAEVVEVATKIVPVAGLGAGEADAQTRQACVDALHQSASTLNQVIPDPYLKTDFPTNTERELSQNETRKILMAERLVKEEHDMILPLVQELHKQAPSLTKALEDEDAEVRILASNTMEKLAAVRSRLTARLGSIPQMMAKEPEKAAALELLTPELQRAVPPLGKNVSDREVKVRLAALYALETLGTAAAPVAPALAKGLEDDNPFVRWGAARALGKMAPQQGKIAVPALAKALADKNGNVRVTAAAALRRYGPAAAPGAKALGEAVKAGDLETRKWAIQALAAIGKGAAPAAPALVTVLAGEEPELRALAAWALGSLGTMTEDTTKALRRALQDRKAAVRQAASEALLRSDGQPGVAPLPPPKLPPPTRPSPNKLPQPKEGSGTD